VEEKLTQLNGCPITYLAARHFNLALGKFLTIFSVALLLANKADINAANKVHQFKIFKYL
jgi:hypothetical protein